MEKFGTRLLLAGIFLLLVVFITAFVDAWIHNPSFSSSVLALMIIATLIAVLFLAPEY